MSTADSTLNHRRLDATDYLDAIRRRRHWFFGPMLAAVVLAVCGSFVWPETYQSTAVLRIQSPIMGPGTASPLGTTIGDRINEMATTVTSVSSLETIINTYGLYPREVKRLPIEDVVELMRHDIQISALQTMTIGDRKSVPAFSIRFSYRDRFLSQKVVTDLAGRFTAENERQRNGGQSLTLVFAKGQLDAARARLDTAEAKLAEFRSKFQGRLPDQSESTLQQINSQQMRFAMLQNSTARVSQELLMLKTNLGIDEEKAANFQLSKREPAARPKSDKLLALERQIAALEPVIANLKEQYTEQHPDLRAARQRLEHLTQDHDRLARAEQQAVPAPQLEAARPLTELEANIRRTRAQIEAKNLELDALDKESRRINETINALDARIQATPGVEREYGEYTRERDLAKADYTENEIRFRRIADGQQGERARLFETLEQLDRASLPTEPVEPKRAWIISLGGVMGLLLGLTLVGTQEWRDPSLKNLKDVQNYTNLTVLSSIPEVENDLVVRRRKRLEFLGWTASIATGCLLMVAAIAYYYANRI